MALTEDGYIERLIDKTISQHLEVFGAISIEGPKWCGKTWTAKNHANSVVLLDDEKEYEKAKLDLDLVLHKTYPQLIDEWQEVPEIWDKVRREVDSENKKGIYILTGSTKLKRKESKEKIHHSGAGRIVKLFMHPMSLYESGDSTGEASIMDMYNDTQKNISIKNIPVTEIVKLIIRGGWPANIHIKSDNYSLIPKGYITSILNDESEDVKFDKRKMGMLLRSLARNETTIVTNKTILNDIINYESDKEYLASYNTLIDYLDILERLHIIENQDSYSSNYVSPKRVGKLSKRHFTDPSLSCAILNLTEEKLLDDVLTLGFMYEALVERDLRIYMEFLGGSLFHFRDNVTGDEVDAILEFSDGEYAAIEIKLGRKEIDDAKKSLLKYYNLTIKKPKFMAIICGTVDMVVKDKETGIYILPITALKP